VVLRSASEIARTLAALDERLAGLRMTTASLAALCAGAVAAHLAGVGRPLLAACCAAIAAVGAAAAAAARHVADLRRTDTLDDVVLLGLRDTPARDAVGKRAAELASPEHRRRLAGRLDRVVAAAASPTPAPVPLNRPAALRCRDRLTALAALLRDTGVEVAPPGVVLVVRLLSDGAESPLFQAGQDHRALARALDRATAMLLPRAPDALRAA
jgi:hypothetical protein